MLNKSSACYLAAMTCLLAGGQLRADNCTLSDWYVSKESKEINWAGSMKAAAANPDSWRKETRWQFGRVSLHRNKTMPVYSVATLTADEDYTQGLSIECVKEIKVRVNGKIYEPLRKGDAIYAVDLKKGANTIELEIPVGSSPRWNKGVLIAKVNHDYIYVPTGKKIEAIETGQVEAVEASGASSVQTIAFSVLPQLMPLIVSYSLLRFETNVRSATILGFVGAGGIGFLIFDKLNGYLYREVCTMMLMVILTVTVIDYACGYIRRKFV